MCDGLGCWGVLGSVWLRNLYTCFCFICADVLIVHMSRGWQGCVLSLLTCATLV